MQCIYCNKISNPGGIGAHQPFCKSNPNRIQRKNSPNAHAKKGSIPWNKDLIGDPRLICSEGKKEQLRKTSTGKASTPEKEFERRSKIKEKSQNNGGYRQGSGRGKKGWYKGFFCDSSWELAYLIYCLDHDINIQRNIERRTYIWEGKNKNYIPDFIVDNQLVEIKGYKSEQWEAKLLANPDVKVLYEEDLKDVFSYVIDKYTKNYTELYGK